MRLRLHDGVVVEDDGTVRDAARRSSHAGADGPALLVHGYAALDLTTRERAALVLAAAATRSRAPLGVLRHAFRRRHAQGPPPVAFAQALLAGAVPAVVVTALLVAAGAAIGALVGASADGVRAGALGALAWWLSMAAHEDGHLLALRAVERDRRLGALEHSWLNVWVVAPVRPSALVAVAGPLAGATACVALAPLLGGWIPWLGAALHLANLAPFAPDGRALSDPRPERGTAGAPDGAPAVEHRELGA